MAIQLSEGDFLLPLFSIFKDHRHFGKQIFLLAKNELLKTYKGALIGPFWAIIKPAFTLFVYWFAFSIGLKKSGGVDVLIHGNTLEFDRFLFMLVGFIPWFFIQDSILMGSKSIRVNSQFVTKVNFPVSTIPTYTVLSRLYVNLFLTVIMYVYVSIVHGVSWYNLQFFIYCPFMFAFFLVFAWSTAPMSAISRDFENIIISIMAGVFWLSGIVYNSYDLPNHALEKIMLFNPINFFVNGYRNAFLYDRWFFEYKTELVIVLAEFIGLFFLGMFNYSRLRKKLPDVM